MKRGSLPDKCQHLQLEKENQNGLCRTVRYYDATGGCNFGWVLSWVYYRSKQKMNTAFYIPLAVGIGAAGWYIGLPVGITILAGIAVTLIIEVVVPWLRKFDSESKSK